MISAVRRIFSWRGGGGYKIPIFYFGQKHKGGPFGCFKLFLTPGRGVSQVSKRGVYPLTQLAKRPKIGANPAFLKKSKKIILVPLLLMFFPKNLFNKKT
jgi:hypothetical protein